MMEERIYDPQLRRRYVRRTCSALGLSLLLYLGIMNGAVLLAVMVESVNVILADRLPTQDQLMANSGWGYFLAIGVGLVCLLIWKKPSFVFRDIWRQKRTMEPGRFLEILSVFVSVQLVMALCALAASALMEALGVEYHAESLSTDSFSIFLYAGLGAPVAEEILFRGLVLRGLEPFGKKFAVFASALLFGLFHGNMTQGPFAFLVGLILGYVALEYDLTWAIVLHMFNNLILSDTLYRLGQMLLGAWADLLVWGTVLLFSVAAVVVLVRRRRQIGGHLRRERMDGLTVRAFFTAPGTVALLAILLIQIVLNESMAMGFIQF